MESVTVKLSGQSPLIMHSRTLANPLHPLTKAIKVLTSKRKKTDADLEEIAHLEFQGGMYYDDSIGPYLPSEVLEACIRSGARFSKRGKDIERGVMVEESRTKLAYPGPRDLAGLWADQRFVDVRGVVVNTGGTVMRCRPIFHEWSATFTVNYNESLINRDDLIQFLEEGGSKCSIGDHRPRYGRFSVEVVNGKH